MTWNPIQSADIAAGAPVLGPTGFGQKVIDCFTYLYGQVATPPAFPENGSFEVDSGGVGVPDHWTPTAYPGGAVAEDTANPGHGQMCIKMTQPSGAGNGGGYIDSDYCPVQGGLSYALSWVLLASVAGIHVKAQVLQYHADKTTGAAALTLYDSTTNPTSWTRERASFTPDAATRYVKVRLIGGYTDTNIAGTVSFDDVIIFASGGVFVTQNSLKVSTGQVSTGSTDPTTLVLPGGIYGFYPQVAASGSYLSTAVASAFGGLSGSFASLITLQAPQTSGGSSAGTTYAQQTYITSSGEVFWVFILRDKTTKAIAGVYAAPDHPCFGNGGDPVALAHPFVKFDGATQEIIVATPDEAALAGIEAASSATVLENILSHYQVDENSAPEWPTVPVTVAPGRKQVIPQPAGVVCRNLVVKG